MKLNYIFILFFLNSALSFSQVPFTFIPTSNISAERVAKYGTTDVSDDFLEITNSTQYDNSFIPSIWAHQQSDERFVLRLFATTNSARDQGTIPMMIFRTEIRNSLNFDAPNGGTFPWGIVKNDVINRPLFGWENGNTQLMRLMSNGYLGLGTVNPSALLHTVGSIRFQDLQKSSNPNFILGTDANGNVFEFDPAAFGGGEDKDWLQLDNSNPSAIDNNIYTLNNVGINSPSPTANLHVNGSVRFQNIQNSTNPSFILGTDSNGNVYKFDSATFVGSTGSPGDKDWLQLDNTNPSSIDNNIYTQGKVGINVSEIPSTIGTEDIGFYNLFVSGGILTEEVRIALTKDWPDYVFKKGYKLPTLEEIDLHIKETGQLINIPTESEVELNGIELGKMNALLLEKIEELTLHVIELNKKINKAQQEIEILKK
jgi:hypothetical protein